MEKLVKGLREFVRTVQPSEQELFARLAHSQEPDALLVTCSDSRISPNLITQTQPGDLFVIRNAGNIVPPYQKDDTVSSEVATVEYATEVLKVHDIIVCGHSNCGAMKGLMALDTLGPKLSRVKAWLSRCEPAHLIASEQFADRTSEEFLQRLTEINVLHQLNNLRTHPSVAAHIYNGELDLHGWVYDIASGHVRAFDSAQGAFVSLVDNPPKEVAVAALATKATDG